MLTSVVKSTPEHGIYVHEHIIMRSRAFDQVKQDGVVTLTVGEAERKVKESNHSRT